MKRRIVRYIISICMLFMCGVSISSMHAGNVSAQENQSRTIRIGYIGYEGFFDKQSDGTFVGYGVSYLQQISKYTGWKYEYVYDSWDNQLKNLKEGKIDLICHAQKTKQRKKDYLFSKYSDGAESSVLYVRADDDRYYYNDFDNFDGMEIAVLKDSFQNAEFKKYAREKGFSYHFKIYDTVAKCFEALDAQKVDAVAMGSLALKSDYKAVCRFGSDPFYFITGKMNQDIIDQIDDAIGEIRATNPYYESQLYEQYYGNQSFSSTPLFTREESEFIDSSDTVNIAFIPNRKPFSYVNDNGEIAGIVVDIVKLLAEKSGLKCNYTMMEAGESAADYLTNHPKTLVAGIMLDNPGFKNSKMILSDQFYSDDVVLACKAGMSYDTDASDATYSLAIPKSYVALKSYINNTYPQFTVIEAKDTKECIKLVESGKADFLAQNVNVLTPLMSDPHYEGLSVMPAFFMSERVGIVCNYLDDNKLLINVIDKCISTVSEDEISQFTVNHTVTNGYKASWGDLVYKFRYPLIVVGILCVVIIMLFAFLIIIKRKSYRLIITKNKQLAEAVIQADRANVAKSSFLARMSHEIRTPMNAIVGLTNIAAHHKNEPDKVEGYLGKIDTSSKVLLNIINDVLDMSAIESEKLKIAHESFNMREILSSIYEIYCTQCAQKGIEFEMNISGINHEHLIGDGLRINQILLNLISNAFKFTPSEGTIYIEAKEVSNHDGKAYINFIVKDTGEGMSEEMQKNLFKPFEQEEAVTARKHGGSGLGLSIAKNLIEMMQGSISCKSKKGAGTEFKVSMPFEIDESVVEDDEDTMKPMRALIVDDDEQTCQYTADILERIGVSYEIVTSGEMAVERLESAKKAGRGLDLCFVDWCMPGVNGADVTRKIRELYTKDTRIIIVSAYDTAQIQDEAQNAGADMCISKPLFQSSVFNLLMKLYGGKFVSKTADLEGYDFEGRKVLLAEDTEFNAEIAIELLDMVNMKVDHARNGLEAVNMFNESKPGTYVAILMDVQMPVMDGYEATRKIRKLQHPEATDIPIFAMTANAFSEDVSDALNVGMTSHIAKPIDTKLLYSMLYKVVKAVKKQD